SDIAPSTTLRRGECSTGRGTVPDCFLRRDRQCNPLAASCATTPHGACAAVAEDCLAAAQKRGAALAPVSDLSDSGLATHIRFGDRADRDQRRHRPWPTGMVA